MGISMGDGSMFSNLEKYQGRAVLYLPGEILGCEIVECRQVSMQDSIYKIVQMEEKEQLEQIILFTCGSMSNKRLILECTVTVFETYTL